MILGQITAILLLDNLIFMLFMFLEIFVLFKCLYGKEFIKK